MAKLSPREMGVEVPHCVRPEVPQEGSVRADTQADGADSAPVMPAKGGGDHGGTRDARPHSSGVADSPEVQCGTGGRVSEREIGDPDSPRGAGCEEGVHREALLVARILCEHGWLG